MQSPTETSPDQESNWKNAAPFEANSRVFIVRVWREAREIEGAKPLWRGMIELIPTGERQYLTTLDEITAFIVRCLVEMGIEVQNDGAKPKVENGRSIAQS